MEDWYEFEGFLVDARQRVLYRRPGDARLELQPRVFDALLHFVRRPGELLDKRELMQTLWPNVIVEENSLNQVVSQLRKALGEKPSEHRFIVTAPGRGYRFVAAVRTPTSDSAPAAAEHHPLSLAVLPFSERLAADITPGLGDAIAADLSHLLSARSRLRVAAHTSSAELRDRETDARRIGEVLNVARVVTGEVSGDQRQLTVNVRLIDTATGTLLWSHAPSGNVSGLADLQGDLARHLAQVIDPEGTRPAANVDVTPDAYLAYLKALSLSQRPSPASVAESIELLRRAIAHSPQFPRARSLLAIQHTMEVMFGFAGTSALQQAREEAAQALALDDRNGETWCAAGVIDCLGGNWVRAEERFRIAHSLTADPLVSGLRCSYLTLSVGQVARAMQQAEYTLHMAPTHPIGVQMLAALHLTMGSDETGRRFAQLSIDQGQSAEMAPLPELFALLELRAGREQAWEKLSTGSGQGGLDPLLRKRLMLWHTWRGSLDDAYAMAFDTADYYAREGTVGGAWGVLWLPEMQPFRDDERFQLFARRLRLFEYWSEYGPPDGYSLKGERLVRAD